MALKPPNEDYFVNLAKGDNDGAEHYNVFGRNSDIDIVDTPSLLTLNKGIYSFPSSGQSHTIYSSSTGDYGQVKSSGTWDNKSMVILNDADATFVSDGVTVGDLVLNDTTHDYSYVTSVDSETQISLGEMHERSFNTVGDSYRVVHPLGTGAAVVNIDHAVDSSYLEEKEFVVLAGTGIVSLSNQYFRVDQAHCLGAGSAEHNGGVITISGTADGIVTNKIDYRVGQTEHAAISVPFGKEAFVTSVWAVTNKVAANPAGAYANLGLFEHSYANASVEGHSDGKRQRQGFSVGIGSPFDRSISPPVRFRQYTDVWLQVNIVSDNDTDLTAGFDVVFLDR